MAKMDWTCGERLLRLRNSLRLSLREVGRGIGLSHESVSRYESDEVEPSQERLRDLAIFYAAKGGIEADEVLRFLRGQRDTLTLSPIIDGKSFQ